MIFQTAFYLQGEPHENLHGGADERVNGYACWGDAGLACGHCDALSKLGGLNRSRLAGSNGIGFAASDKLEGRLKNRFRRPLRMIAYLAYAP